MNISNTSITTTTHQQHRPQKLPQWRLRSATSETVIPIILPYLSICERAKCQLVCTVWRFVVQEWGVAQVVDVKRCLGHHGPGNNSHEIRSFLRGVIANSYSSLRSLFLNDYHQLTRDDLHPALPRLKKLRQLDISRCTELNDETLTLVATHLSGSLEMLYMKGLRNVTDQGVVSVASHCRKLKVLEISNVKVLTDVSATAIGTHLSRLEALYMRDNWRLTNEGIKVITHGCKQLTQLTLWGLVKWKCHGGGDGDGVVGHDLRHGPPTTHTPSPFFAMGKNLVLLNLWGCHGLRDDFVHRMAGLRRLRTLIVSECHCLTDDFVVTLVRLLPRLHHLHLRYLRHLSDAAVHAVATHCRDSLSSLDVSFCTKITATALATLLSPGSRLHELRLYHCAQVGDELGARYELAHAIVVRDGDDDGALRLLDWRTSDGDRRAGGRDGSSNVRDDATVTVTGGRRIVRGDVTRMLTGVHFEEKVPGFFVRPAR